MDDGSSDDSSSDNYNSESLDLSWTNILIFIPDDDMTANILSSPATRQTESLPSSDFGDDHPAVLNMPPHSLPPYLHLPEDQQSVDHLLSEGINESLDLSFSWSDVPVFTPNNTSSGPLLLYDVELPPLHDPSPLSPCDANLPPPRNTNVWSPLPTVADDICMHLFYILSFTFSDVQLQITLTVHCHQQVHKRYLQAVYLRIMSLLQKAAKLMVLVPVVKIGAVPLVENDAPCLIVDTGFITPH